MLTVSQAYDSVNTNRIEVGHLKKPDTAATLTGCVFSMLVTFSSYRCAVDSPGELPHTGNVFKPWGGHIMSKKTAVKDNRKASAEVEHIVAQIRQLQETPLLQILDEAEIYDPVAEAAERLEFVAEDLRRAGL